MSSDEMKSSKALDTTKAFQEGADMSDREQSILEHIVESTGFEPEKVIWRSSYYGTKQIGAVHYVGKFNNEEAVLKIQGVKPDISESYMIGQFAQQNRSRIVRPPKLFSTIPWSDDQGYEALLMEFVSGPKVLDGKKLQSKENIEEFYKVYQEYRQNCLPNKPWLPEPERPNLQEVLEKIIANADKAYPNDPRRQPGDKELAAEAYKVLEEFYKDKPLMEFQHGHFSVEDLLRSGDEVVIFSNLFWKYRPPLFDAVFGYHWCILELNHVEDITPQQVDEQRELWQQAMMSVPFIKESEENQNFVKAVILERAVASFLLDSLLVDVNKPIANYLTESSRDQTRKFMAELSSKS